MMMPTEESGKPGLFDRFADLINQFTSRAWFFLACVLLVLIWAPSFLVVGNIDTWQLLINTPTTVITFLLVALQANTSKRSDASEQAKLNAIADGLADLMEHFEVTEHAHELREAVGLEEKEST
ncbi:hypothetical protein PBI_ARCHERS7_107 [Mycobacterium phage ArcherS7]|uniref:Uncharacterized protein n=4 Tax=Bixzunavirus TaxID=680114 RepID=A0A0F7DD69_9CAUD|nr:membrane protein [Mycobacterium phage ArcherS7]YP_010058429.1 membrane protein [Mycobacterium phage Quasimodo]AEJ94808.1 hypothetical protein GHOST_107 [Mycobacterium phage Ghost]AKG94670.1 hypothetical protein SEA_MOMO_107 [Mycobacterium phage Momo]ATN87328.1 hypothetical protein SEA_AUDRICK_110 [Mycobacterium phage Audrick]AVI04706.1 membrane protein [Mycobacterium phage LifeSavor]AWY09725.1 hypothetical protein SEA_DEREK_108 [Mycobacterium phage Derek]AXY85620.1 hypothetical protein SE